MPDCRNGIKMIIRKYNSSDCKYIIELFYHTVHTVNAKDYTEEQLNAWANGKADIIEWDKSLSSHYTIVALTDNLIVGFGDIDKTGYLDRLYVHKDYQGQGIGSALCEDLEKAFKVNKITTHASITAKPFFLNRGYKQTEEQQVIRCGVTLTNYIMEKQKIFREVSV